MPLSLYDISVPVLLRQLGILDGLLDRGRAFADETGLDHAALLQARLAPDMLPLIGQVQRACDTSKFVAVRVGLVPNLSMADEEASFDDLKARIGKTVAVLREVPSTAFDGREDAEIALPAGGAQRVFSGRSYVLDFALPNVFFHVATAYDLLRQKGVPIGKRHYLGWE